MKKTLLSIALLAMAWSTRANDEPKAEGEPEEQGRVQYTLILPEEKTPELVKAEENNPFESSAVGAEKDEGTTEENQVREILLRLPATGGASGPSGMRVMLGGMRLVEGAEVPAVLPDQQVVLKVKSISSSAVELLWVDKKPTGLPPKVLTIPLDGAPKVRYQLPTQGSPNASARPAGVPGMGSLRRNGVAVLLSPAEAGNVQVQVATPVPVPVPVPAPVPAPAAAISPPASPLVTEAGPPAPPPTTADPLPAPAEMSEAPVFRMLFGNHAPAGK